MADLQAADSLRFNVSGFKIEGDLPIPEADAQAVLKPYVGPSVTIEQLQEAATALEEELSRRGLAFYSVALPAQSLEGAVTLRVLKFRLGNVSVAGNKYFSTENVLASLPALRLGESPNVAQVARNRAAANEHPAKELDITFKQSQAADSVDADVTVRDQRPQSFFIGLNNIGDHRTGSWRASLGYQHSNLWNRDHSLTASYTTSPDHTGDVKQYGLYYRVPFYAVGGALTVFYAFSDVNSGTIANAFDVSGRGQFMGLHWKQHLTPLGPYSHAVELGFDDRFFDNNVVFGTTQLGVDVRSRPLTLGYHARLDRTESVLNGTVQYVKDLRGGSDHSNVEYSGNRAGASPGWDALRYSLDAYWRVAPLTLGLRVRGQYSDEPLIPGEQFGLGGAQSVRGLREREATGDRGILVTLEASTPLPWEGFTALVFVDGGEVRLKNAGAGQLAGQGAASFGIGLRWVLARTASLAVDVAQVIDGVAAGAQRGDRRVHVSFVIRF